MPGITKKDRPLTAEHFAEFEKCFGDRPQRPRQTQAEAIRRPRRATSAATAGAASPLAEVKERDFKLDSFKWLKDDSLEDADELPAPEELATDAIAELEGGGRGTERGAGAAGEREWRGNWKVKRKGETMKRDMDLVRKILMACEDDEHGMRIGSLQNRRSTPMSRLATTLT